MGASGPLCGQRAGDWQMWEEMGKGVGRERVGGGASGQWYQCMSGGQGGAAAIWQPCGQRATEWGDLGAQVAEILDQIGSLKLHYSNYIH